jgi:hypothetical protein
LRVNVKPLLLLAAVIPFSMLSAQEEKPEPKPGPPAFPLFSLLETASSAGEGIGLWRPDWPPEFPPDAFMFTGEAAAVTIGEDRFVMSRDEGTAEFPFLLEGSLVQARVIYGGSGIGEITLEGARSPDAAARQTPEAGPEKGEPVKLEVLEYGEAYPALVRVYRDGVYSFVLFRQGGSFVSESWYDEAGAALCFYEYQLSRDPGARVICLKTMSAGGETRTWYQYDSRFLLTGISGPEGDFSVNYYRQDLPRYWERKPAAGSGAAEADASPEAADPGRHYSLQWDEAGFLVRVSGSAEGSGEFTDYRYEYTLDERGNWIERREYRMSRSFGLLSASPGTKVTRVLKYGGSQ